MKFWSTIYILGIVLSSFIVNGATACTKPTMAGLWVNPKAALNEISSLEIKYNCGDKPAKSYDPLSSAKWVVRGRTQCQRTECILGRAKGKLIRQGFMQVSFSGFSTITELSMSEDNGLLRVEAKTRYRDELRKPVNKVYYLQQKK